MILPLTHERATVGRLPWVTFGIVALCGLGLWQTESHRPSTEASEERFEDAIRYFVERPYLEPDPRLVPPQLKELLDPALLAEIARGEPSLAQQGRLDRLTASWLVSLGGHPLWRDGLVPARFDWNDLFSHMFLHAGFWHFFGNMLFLYLTGPYLEDAWGRLLFLAFYVGAGVAAAGAFCLHYPDLFRPLVGASGAVAGVMGAFLVLHWRTRIRFVYWFGILVGTFRAPTWVMLPLWFVGELSAAVSLDRAMPGGVGGGVAYWAHVWGFALGLVVALVVRRLGAEDELTRVDGPTRTAEGQDDILQRALTEQSRGRPDEALRLLTAAVRSGDASLDAQALQWELAVEQGLGDRAAPFARRLIRAELESGRLRKAVGHLRQLEQATGDSDPLLLLKAAEASYRRQQTSDGNELLARAVEGLVTTTPVGTVSRALELSSRHHTELYPTARRKALDNPGLPPETRAELELEQIS